ncbi:MAG: four helix bundle protein [Balneolaceae bacterium]|nr:MAG: four helix bundle protein [Balneolaceae bacterium]
MLQLNHKKLNAWVKSIELVKAIYSLTISFPKEELYGLTSQLRRASVSVPSNIAEGSSRKSKSERSRFYEIARSSLVEIDTQIVISMELGYLRNDDITELEQLANEIFAMLSAMK